MDAIIATALDTARQLGAQYADLRLVQNREERIVVRNGIVETLSRRRVDGFGHQGRLFDGAWGFASTRRLTNEAADQAAGQAVQIARASARHNGPGLPAADVLGPPVKSTGNYATPLEVDPFTVSLDDKLRSAAVG